MFRKAALKATELYIHPGSAAKIQNRHTSWNILYIRPGVQTYTSQTLWPSYEAELASILPALSQIQLLRAHLSPLSWSTSLDQTFAAFHSVWTSVQLAIYGTLCHFRFILLVFGNSAEPSLPLSRFCNKYIGCIPEQALSESEAGVTLVLLPFPRASSFLQSLSLIFSRHCRKYCSPPPCSKQLFCTILRMDFFFSSSNLLLRPVLPIAPLLLHFNNALISQVKNIKPCKQLYPSK